MGGENIGSSVLDLLSLLSLVEMQVEMWNKEVIYSILESRGKWVGVIIWELSVCNFTIVGVESFNKHTLPS